MHYHLDQRRILVLPGNAEQTLDFAVKDWVDTAKAAIADHGFFAVALSGGSTPKKIFKELSSKHQNTLDWSKVYLFWSDERAVLPSDKDSNFHMAMIEGGLTALPIDAKNIFRMVAEKDIEANASDYERIIKKTLGKRNFDLIMLGMGDDGHTASLFPGTRGVDVKDRLVTSNYITQKKTWRMSFTYKLINSASYICIYVLGANKADILARVLYSPLDPSTYPSQNVGSEEHKATWIIDEEAAQDILANLK